MILLECAATPDACGARFHGMVTGPVVDFSLQVTQSKQRMHSGRNRVT